MKYNTFVFDLDGTLTDTLADLRNSVNYALSEFGFSERSREEIRSFVGNGVRKLVYRSVPQNTSDEIADKCLEIFKAHYKENSCVETKPYNGIIELLKELKKRNIKTAVVTNKMHGAATDIVEHFFGGLIDVTIGQADEISPKPAPDSVFLALEKLGASKENAIYIGDSEVDCMTAHNAGIPCIGVTWGFRDREVLEENGAEYIFDKAEEIIELISGC